MAWWNATTVCKNCGNGMPRGKLKCPGCGAIHGEQNRCPFCREYVGVKAVGATYVCANCDRVRQPKQGTVVVTRRQVLERKPLGARSNDARDRALGMSLAGMMSIGYGLAVAGLVTKAVSGIGGALMAGGLLVAGLGFGVFALRTAFRSARQAREFELASDELAVLELAHKHDGRLTLVQVVRELHVPVRRAEEILAGLVDGMHITLEVHEGGALEYVFRDAPLVVKSEGRGSKVRVAADEEAHEAEDEESKHLRQ